MNKPTKKKVKIEQIYFIFHGSIGGKCGDATGYMAVNFGKKYETKILAKNCEFRTSNDIVVSELKKKKIKKNTCADIVDRSFYDGSTGSFSCTGACDLPI